MKEDVTIAQILNVTQKKLNNIFNKKKIKREIRY